MNGPKKQTGVSIWISVKTHFKQKPTRSDKEGKIHWDASSVINISTPNTRAAIFENKHYTLNHTGSSYTNNNGILQYLTLTTEKSFRQKLNREMLALTNVIKQMNLKMFTKPFTQTKENIPSSQHITKVFPKLMTYLYTKAISQQKE